MARRGLVASRLVVRLLLDVQFESITGKEWPNLCFASAGSQSPENGCRPRDCRWTLIPPMSLSRYLPRSVVLKSRSFGDSLNQRPAGSRCSHWPLTYLEAVWSRAGTAENNGRAVDVESRQC